MNPQYGFEFQYPSNWTIFATSTGSGTLGGTEILLTAPSTTIAQDVAGSGMTISVTDLTSPTISATNTLMTIED
jgi:hypothetical protein